MTASTVRDAAPRRIKVTKRRFNFEAEGRWILTSGRTFCEAYNNLRFPCCSTLAFPESKRTRWINPAH